MVDDDLAEEPFDAVLRDAFAAAPATDIALAGVVTRGAMRRRRRFALRSAALVAVVACVVAIVAVRTTGGNKAGVSVSPPNGKAAVGPFPPDPKDPTKKDTHWHAALGVYDCDHWVGDGSGSGIWNWPVVTPAGGPGRAANSNLYAGLHSHDDGVIHMEPVTADEAGENATLGRYFEFGGWKLSSTGFAFLGATRNNGDQCGTTPGKLQWAVGRWDGTRGRQTYVVQSGDPAHYKLFQFDVVVLAFLPEGKSISSIGDPPSVAILAGEMGVQSVPSSSRPPLGNP
jgi:hypothetical protein